MTTEASPNDSKANYDVDPDICDRICDFCQNQPKVAYPPVVEVFEKDTGDEADKKDDPHRLVLASRNIAIPLCGTSFMDYTSLTTELKDVSDFLLSSYVIVASNRTNCPGITLVYKTCNLKFTGHGKITNGMSDAISDIVIKTKCKGRLRITMNGLPVHSKFNCAEDNGTYVYCPVDSKGNRVFNYPNILSLCYLNPPGFFHCGFVVEFDPQKLEDRTNNEFEVQLRSYTFPEFVRYNVIGFEGQRLWEISESV